MFIFKFTMEKSCFDYEYEFLFLRVFVSYLNLLYY